MNFIDLSGRHFGRLLVLRRVENQRSGRLQYLCLCVCGTQRTIVANTLRNGDAKSCGCLKLERITKPPGVAARNRVLKAYRCNAKNRDLAWYLSDESFARLIGGNCFYCGTAPCRKTTDTKTAILYNGIDRRDNSKGYDEENCVSCCKSCNRAKDVMSSDEFIAWANRIAVHTSTRTAV